MQQLGLGTALIAKLVSQERVPSIIAHTRNPAVITALSRIATVFPIMSSAQMLHMAEAIPHTEVIEGIAYHTNRYGVDGLYGNFDPADRCLPGHRISLKDEYIGLENPRTALVVVASVNKEVR